jgi:hypothetical protein
MAPVRRSRIPLAIASLLLAVALSGCAAGTGAAVDTSQPPTEQVHELIAHVEEEGGEEAVEALKEHRHEFEEAQQAREEQPGEAGEQAEAEGAEVRDAVEMHETEQEAAEEAEEGPEHPEREPGVGRMLREG